ncbi:hypothetical protein TWF506_001673 [Arthrobotrys conoides]|uniref:Uncharacterized protein n=1 Tax=Arthrobotrys conoides TaxID=74498 RepID=A0AAN8S5L3_9PEZI
MTIPDIVRNINGNQCLKRMFELRLALEHLPADTALKDNFYAIMRDIKDQKITSFPPNMGYLYREGVMVYGRSISVREREMILKHIRLEGLGGCWWETGPNPADLLRATAPAAENRMNSNPEADPGFAFCFDVTQTLQGGLLDTQRFE